MEAFEQQLKRENKHLDLTILKWKTIERDGLPPLNKNSTFESKPCLCVTKYNGFLVLFRNAKTELTGYWQLCQSTDQRSFSDELILKYAELPTELYL